MQATAPTIQLASALADTDSAQAPLTSLDKTPEDQRDEETYDIEAGFLSLLSSFETRPGPQGKEFHGDILQGDVVHINAETPPAKNDNRGDLWDAPPLESSLPSSPILPPAATTKPLDKDNATPTIQIEESSASREPITKGDTSQQDQPQNVVPLPTTSTKDVAQEAFNPQRHEEISYIQLTHPHNNESAREVQPIIRPAALQDALEDTSPSITLAQPLEASTNGPSSSSAAPLSSISPALMLNQVVTHLRENLAPNQPQQTFTLTLIPAELGQITIDAFFEGAALSLSFQGLPATLDLLKTHQGLLIQNLSTQGIVVRQDNLSFTQDHSHKNQDEQPGSAQDPPPTSFKKLRDSLQRLKQGLFA